MKKYLLGLLVVPLLGAMLMSGPKAFAAVNDQGQSNFTANQGCDEFEDNQDECPAPTDPCVADPTLPECVPVDPCLTDPTLPACVPVDPCVVDSTLPECLPVGPFDDGDGVPAEVEDSSVAADGTPIPGDDNNFDGIADSLQSGVTTLPNPNDQVAPGSFVTIEVLPTTLTFTGFSQVIWNITSFSPVAPADLEGGVPANQTFPVGMFNLSLAGIPEVSQLYTILQSLCLPEALPLEGIDCATATQILSELSTVQVRLLFDRVIDHSSWTVQQYINGAYVDYAATVEDLDIGFLRTTITWTLVDGGTGDQDGVMNASINDPIGPTVKAAVVVTPGPGTGTGGTGAGGAQTQTTATTVASVTTAATQANAVTSAATAAKSDELANTGTSPLAVLFAVLLILATIYVARSKQTA